MPSPRCRVWCLFLSAGVRAPRLQLALSSVIIYRWRPVPFDFSARQVLFCHSLATTVLYSLQCVKPG